MEKRDCTLCPVCSLYLREGITLKSHLQTHSKEKVIEALLFKQDPLNSTPSNDDSVLSLSNSPVENDTTSPSSIESRFFSTVNRANFAVPTQPSFVQPSNHQIGQSTPSLSYDGNIQYSPVINNLLSQSAVNNSCNALLTYQTYVTNEGNMILSPVYYNMCPPSVMLSNNIVPTTSVMNPCVVMPSSNAIESVSSNDVISSATKYTPATVQDSCVNAVENNETIEDVLDHQSGESEDSEENEKATDEEVANIFKVSERNEKCNVRLASRRVDSMSYNSDLTAQGKSDDESNATMYLESDICSPSSTPSGYMPEDGRTSITPSVSVIRVRNDLNYKSPVDEGADNDNDECYSSVPSTSTSSTMTNVISSSNLVEQQRKCAALDLSDGRAESVSSIEPEDDENEYDEEEYSRGPSEPTTLNKEKECYILPNSDIPQLSPSSVDDFNFMNISKNLLTSASLISVNKTMFASDKNGSNFFGKCEVMKSEEKQISTRTLTNYIVKLTDKEEEDYHMNVNENFGSASSSRTSPFDIQTDESMPARGELSGQESLSSTENSIWELQVQQNTCVQRYSISCKGENSGIKIGLRSLMTEMNLKRDGENLKSIDFGLDKTPNKLVGQNFKNKQLREFHCFYCQKTFNTWKSRQEHIVEKHAEEDGLTVESLFGKRMKYKEESTERVNENDVDLKNDTESAVALLDNIICRMCSAPLKSTVALLKHLRLSHDIKKRSLVCPTCFVRFNTIEEYRQHIRKEHPYECMTCGKQFYTRPGYMLHQKRHMKIKPYSCNVCAKSFVTKQKLSEHVNIHTGENPIKCDMCDSNFKRYSNYQQHKKYLHMNCKRKLKDFVCDCGEVFHSKVKLLWHQEIHDQKPKQCPFCVERFVHAASLTRHVRKWHNEMYLSEWVQKKKNVLCPVCNVSYLHTSLQTHMKIHEGVKPFSCGECSKTFRTKWNLQLHRWTHMSRSAKPFKCKLCVKAYIHKTDYDAHVRSHNNCRPYACNVCGRQFIRKYNCIRHMREHIEPRSYKCEVCGKEFARSYYLSEHEKVHTGEKPHICHFCGKASATKSNHNKHVKMHTTAREAINSEA